MGDHVRDVEKDTEMVVVERIVERADECYVDENNTVADYNPGYPEDDRVIACCFPKSHQLELQSSDSYKFPRKRLRITHRPESD